MRRKKRKQINTNIYGVTEEGMKTGGLYQVGSFPSRRRWAEWNGRYRDDMWRFLKGDDGLHETALKRIFGSPDLYNPQYRGGGKMLPSIF